MTKRKERVWRDSRVWNWENKKRVRRHRNSPYLWTDAPDRLWPLWNQLVNPPFSVCSTRRAFGPNEQLQGPAHGRRWFLFPLPGSNLDAIMWLESRKVLSKQHTSRSRVKDGVVMETQPLSSRLGTVMSTWAPEHVLFSHSGILEIPLRVPEPRWEDFYWSVIISLKVRCYMWSWLEPLTSDLVFSASLHRFCVSGMMRGKNNNNFLRI